MIKVGDIIELMSEDEVVEKIVVVQHEPVVHGQLHIMGVTSDGRDFETYWIYVVERLDGSFWARTWGATPCVRPPEKVSGKVSEQSPRT